jgi:citrate lyase subunit beta/citryl-CoA lyase
MAGHGEAGRREADVRSDLFVRIALADSGGRDVEVRSKVAAMYGASIRADVERVLDAYGVAHAHAEVDDGGALPFVIAARVEAALQRAGCEATDDARPAKTVPSDPASAKDRLRRSRLYLPGNEPKFMVNAGLHRPDGVILDLEDSVHAAEKDAARLLVRNALRTVEFHGAERMVRINQLPTGFEDLDAVVPEDPEVILIPKTEHPEQVRLVHERILEIQQATGSDKEIWLMPILETALGIEEAYAIATATESVVAMTIGLEDYTADLGVVKTAAGTESLYARQRLVNVARAAGVQAIDSVYGDVGDTEGLVSWATRSSAMGFEGMGCIHPRQIAPIHAAFAPTQAELDKALAIVDAFAEAERRGLAVVSLGTRMIDPPVVLRAQRLVRQAKRAGLQVDVADGEVDA